MNIYQLLIDVTLNIHAILVATTRCMPLALEGGTGILRTVKNASILPRFRGTIMCVCVEGWW